MPNKAIKYYHEQISEQHQDFLAPCVITIII